MAKSGAEQEAFNQLVLSYTAIRRSLGVLGLALPPLLLLASLLSGQPLGTSISACYYGAGGTILVGTLCAMAVFLWSYLGYQPEAGEWPSDRLIARIAAVAALLVALVPCGNGTAPTLQTCTFVECLTLRAPFSPTTLHFLAAGTFFLMIATFCLVNFRRGGASITREKHNKNLVFAACGAAILACIVVLAARALIVSPDSAATGPFVFAVESVAVWAFALAWLVKGEAYRLVIKPKSAAA